VTCASPARSFVVEGVLFFGNRNREVVASLMARRSAQSVLKRAREQALREKRELKQAKKEARRRGDDPSSGDSEGDAAPQDSSELER
jgi:hypothetical protein